MEKWINEKLVFYCVGFDFYYMWHWIAVYLSLSTECKLKRSYLNFFKERKRTYLDAQIEEIRWQIKEII